MARSSRSSQHQGSPGVRPTLAERRQAALARRRSASRRRRALVLAVAAVLAGAAIAACSTIKSSDKHTGTTPPSSNGGSTSTTAARPTSYDVGLTTFHWTDGDETTITAAGGTKDGRVLTTEVRYPTLSGSATSEKTDAPPATTDGPFPVIVFAHGFDVSPQYYAPLLDAWVRAGFIVVSPLFPDENTATVNANGGPAAQPAARNLELDEYSEPSDIVFVLKQFDIAAEKGSGKIVAGLADTSDVALAGQSDGADVVAALEFDSHYSSELAALPAKAKAVLVLSGEEWYGTGNSYAASSSSPPLLQVQSNADTCNGAESAAILFSHLSADPVHLFETLNGAAHLQPYTDLVPGQNPYAPVVEKATTAFLELELGWDDKGLSISSVEAAGTSSGVSSISETVGSFTTAPSADPAVCTDLPT